MNRATWKAQNRLELTIISVKQQIPTFKNEHVVSHDFLLKPDTIVIYSDDTTKDVYKRIKDSCYWRCVGLRGYEFSILVKLSL